MRPIVFFEYALKAPAICSVDWHSLCLVIWVFFFVLFFNFFLMLKPLAFFAHDHFYFSLTLTDRLLPGGQSDRCFPFEYQLCLRDNYICELNCCHVPASHEIYSFSLVNV